MRNVYLVQVNELYGDNCFLPYSVGLIQAYCQSLDWVNKEYCFKELIYLRERPDAIVERMENPDVVGFSCYIWNWEFNKVLAKKVREVYPDCLIVFGGPHVPKSVGLRSDIPDYVDVVVYHEGEVAFSETLRARCSGLKAETLVHRSGSRIDDLSILPSPYLTGVFDTMLEADYNHNASQETHRGCAYSCSFCYWGSAVLTKVRAFDDERLVREFEWMGQHQIELLYNCFGRETQFITKRGVASFYMFEDGDTVEVVTHRGQWKKAIVRNYGNQKLREIRYSKGGLRGCLRVVRATQNHRWILSDGRETTCLEVGDRLMSGPHVFDFDYNSVTPDERLYWCYGFVYGDGTRVKNRDGEYLYSMVRLCKQDIKFRSRFEELGFSTSTSHSLVGDFIAFTGTYLKTLPDILVEPTNRVRAFVAGFLEADGSKSYHHNKSTRYKAIQATGKETIEFIRTVFPMVGIYILGEYVISNQTNLGFRRSETVLFRITENLATRKNASWRVVSVGDQTVLDSAWGLEVEEDHSFVFPCGVVTGNCDANYGLLPRDVELTEAMVSVKAHYGYPKTFRAAYAKNSNQRVLDISRMVHQAGMSKGTTLSFQSLHPAVLRDIRRSNIEIDDFKSLLAVYRQEGIPTYTELILGLPGETYDSFTRGIEQLLEAGQHEGLNVYLLSILPSAEMSDPEYQKKYGMKLVRSPLLQQHVTPSQDGIQEYCMICTETVSMPLSDWVRSYMFAWVVQAFHGFGLLREVAMYLREFHRVTYREFYEWLLQTARRRPYSLLGEEYTRTLVHVYHGIEGESWGAVDERYGNVIWPTEELTYLNIAAQQSERFYQEMAVLLRLQWDDVDVSTRLGWDRVQVRTAASFGGDLEEFAKQAVWYARKRLLQKPVSAEV